MKKTIVKFVSRRSQSNDNSGFKKQSKNNLGEWNNCKYFIMNYKSMSLIHNATIWATLVAIFLSSLASWSIWTGNHIGPMLLILSIIYSLDNLKLEEKVK